MEALMVGKIETDEKRRAWQNGLDQLHKTIRDIIKAQKTAKYCLVFK